MMLHEAIEKVLKKYMRSMTAREIAAEINSTGLYNRKDGNPVPTSQIHARINNYPEKFIKDNNKIGLFNSNESFFKNFRSGKPKELEEILDELTKEIYVNYNLPEAESVIFICTLAIASKNIGIKIDWEGLPLAYETEEFIRNINEVILDIQELNEAFEILLKNKNILTKEFFKRISFDIGYKVNQVSDDELNKILINYIRNVGFFGKQRFLAKFNTPDFLNKLIIALADIQYDEVIFDPAAGLGKTLEKVANEKMDNRLIGQEIDFNSYLINKLYFFLLGINNYELRWADSLKNSKILEKSVDVIVSDIPFGARINGQEVNFPTIIHKNTYSSEELFLEYMLSRINSNGRIVSTIPLGVLFSSSYKHLREYLIEYDLVESIITLPTGTNLPYASINSAIILLNKNKKQNNRHKVLFIDLETSINLKVVNNRLEYDERQVSKVIKSVKSIMGDQFLEQSEIKYSLIETSRIRTQGYDLSPNRYDQKVLDLLNEASKSGELVPLMEILEKIHSLQKAINKKDIKYVQIRDLSNDPVDYYLDIGNVKSTISGVPSYKIIDESALLLARVGNNLKPTYFNFRGQQIAINQNILALRVNENIINVGYLITQLNSEFIHKQFNLIIKGAGIPTFSPNSFLNLKIPLPPFSEQLNRLAIFKEQYSQKLTITQFIDDIKLVSSISEIKEELERFARKTLPRSKHISFKREFEFEKFPFSNKELEETKYIKYSKDGHYSYLFLHDKNRRTNGILVVDSEQEISYKKYSEINAYSNFLLATSEFITKEVADDSLAKFAHTSKNFFMRLVGEIGAIIDSKNSELMDLLSTQCVESTEMIERKRKQGRDLSQYLVLNKLKRIHQQISSISKFYQITDFNFKEIKDGKYSDFDIVSLIKESATLAGNVDISCAENEILVHSKMNVVKQSIADLLQNSTGHSPDNKSTLELRQYDSFVSIIILNDVANIIPEETYKLLGSQWLTSQNELGISKGLYWARVAIENSEGILELLDFSQYERKKKFQVTIKLKKAL